MYGNKRNRGNIMENEIKNMKGEQGGEFFEDGDTFSGVASGFTAITDTTLTSMTTNYVGSTKVLTPVVISAGTFVAGLITDLEVLVGVVQMHNALN